MRMMSNQGESAAVALSRQEDPISVAIIEDHREFRDYLTALISGSEGFECVGSFRSVEDALSGVNRNVPDVILLDIGLPGMSGIEGIRLFKEPYPEIILLNMRIHA